MTRIAVNNSGDANWDDSDPDLSGSLLLLKLEAARRGWQVAAHLINMALLEVFEREGGVTIQSDASQEQAPHDPVIAKACMLLRCS